MCNCSQLENRPHAYDARMTTLDPSPILQLLQANQATAAVKSAIDLGVFAALAGGASTPEQVANAIGCPVRSTTILLDCLAVVGAITRPSEAARYELTPVTRAFLVPGAQTYLGDVAQIFAGPHLWNALGSLTDAVRAGGSVMEQHAETPSHAFWETFARSSAPLAMPAAAALAEILAPNARGKTLRVLDVAAGSGIYGHMLARAHGCDVTFVDWPNVLEETQAWGERLGVDRSRTHYRPGSVFEIDLGGPYDVVIASHLFHHFDPRTCQTLMRRLASVVAPGGSLAVHDFVPGPGISNPGATMFSLIMLVWTRAGRAYGQDEYTAWMTEAGLARPTAHPLPGMPSTWLVATRA